MLYCTVHPINTIMQRKKKAVNPPFKLRCPPFIVYYMIFTKLLKWSATTHQTQKLVIFNIN